MAPTAHEHLSPRHPFIQARVLGQVGQTGWCPGGVALRSQWDTGCLYPTVSVQQTGRVSGCSTGQAAFGDSGESLGSWHRQRLGAG
jgi:hypothetical protein